MTKEIQPIIFFDGVCSLCNSSVNLLMKLDKKQRLHYASLQGSTSTELLHDDIRAQFNSIVLLHQTRVYFKSNAVLKTLSLLGGLWKLTAVFYIIPICWRDKLYDFVARNRYKWFGKRNTCRMPTEKEKGLLLN